MPPLISTRRENKGWSCSIQVLVRLSGPGNFFLSVRKPAAEVGQSLGDTWAGTMAPNPVPNIWLHGLSGGLICLHSAIQFGSGRLLELKGFVVAWTSDEAEKLCRQTQLASAYIGQHLRFHVKHVRDLRFRSLEVGTSSSILTTFS